MRPKKEKVLLTDVELEFMRILWTLGKGSVRDVINHLPASRKLAYTSVSTIIRILEQKDILESHREGNSHIYTPVMSKNQYEGLSLKHLVRHVFEDEPASMVTRLLEVEDGQMSQEELKQIKYLIDTRLKK